jgi:predicted amidohydrolase
MLTVALVQRPPVFLDLPASVARAVEIVAEAARDGAQLVVFPESWLPGYPVWLDEAPDAARWGHAPAEALFRHLLRNAPTVDGPEVAALAGAAVEHNADVIMGLHERRGATLYNSIVSLGADGSRHLHRKLAPTYNERLIWGSGDGSTLGVWDRPYGKVGGLVCWEHWMPLVRAAMHAQDETIHVAQWPAVGERHQLASRTYAFEGQCFVLASGCVLTRDDVLAGFDSSRGAGEARDLLASIPAERYWLKDGGSAVIGPDAEYIVRPVFRDTATVMATLDPEAAKRSPYLDVHGHYARPDIFELRVDTTRREGVCFAEGPA